MPATPLLFLFLVLPAFTQQAPEPLALERFGQERLLREDYVQVVAVHGTMEPLTDQPTASTPLDEYTPASLERWGIFTGQGEQLDAFSFAAQVGDTPTLDQLRAATTRTRTRGWIGAGIGAAALGGGLGLVASSMLGEMSDDARTVRSVGGAALGFGGLVGVTAGIRFVIAPEGPHRAVEKSWTPDSADELIRSHNEDLRRTLGLTEEQVRGIDSSEP